MIDFLFLSIAVVLGFIGWNTSFRWISIALVADFCAHIGFDVYMMSEEFIRLVGYEQMYYMFMPLKGTLAMIFFIMFINVAVHLDKSTPSSRVSIILAILSAISGIFHFFNAYLQVKGIYIGSYESIMMMYCITQLMTLAGGLIYGYVYRISSHYPGWNHYFHRH